MKKIFAVLLCAMLVSSCAAISAAAYESPTYNPGESDTDPNGGGGDGGDKDKNSDSDTSTPGSKDSDSDKDGSSSKNGSSSSTSSTSPKTGAPVSYGVLMAAAALAFGGVAVSSKKKIED